MKKMMTWAGLWVILSGCSWDNEESLYPDTAVCDTTSVSFSTHISALLAQHCLSCHGNQSATQFAQGIALEDYEDVAAASNLILGAINHREGFPSMPKNGEKLSPCQIATFEAWVNQGSPDH